MDHQWEWVHTSPSFSLQSSPALTTPKHQTFLKGTWGYGVLPTHPPSEWLITGSSHAWGSPRWLYQAWVLGHGEERRDGGTLKLAQRPGLSLNQWLTGLMDQMSAQHLPESRHLTPTERLQRNCSSMALYYEKILGTPPLDLPETLWKWPDANLVF